MSIIVLALTLAIECGLFASLRLRPAPSPRKTR